MYFVVIVIALLWHGQSLPDRGALVEPRLPKAPTPKRVIRQALVAGGVGLIAVFLLPYDLRRALIAP